LKDLLLLQSGRSVRRLRLAERGLARARRAAILLTIVASVGLGGAWIERQRAEQEAKGRRTAEAERDQLARLTLYSAGLARAQRALETGDYGRARELLRELIPAAESTEDLRGFEWRALWHEAQGDPAEVIRDSGPAVDRVFFSPDGRWFAVHDASKTVTVYEAANRTVKRAIGGVYRLAGFSPDGRWMIGSTHSFLLQAWNIDTGEVFGAPQAEARFNHPVAVLPRNGTRVLLLTSDQEDLRLRIWDLTAREEIASWPMRIGSAALWECRVTDVEQEGSTCSLVVRHERARAATFHRLVWNLEDPSAELIWPDSHHPQILSVSAHALEIAKLGQKRANTLLNRETPMVQSIDGASEISAVTFSHDRTTLAVGSKQGGLRLMDVRTGEQRPLLEGHGGSIMALAWSPDDRRLISSDNKGQVRLWHVPSAPTNDILRILKTGGGRERQFCFSPDSRSVVVHIDQDEIARYDLVSLEVLQILPGRLSLSGFFADGALSTVSPEGILHVWNPDGSLSPESHFPGENIAWALVDESGTRIVAVSSGGDFWVKERFSSDPPIRHHLNTVKPQHLLLSPNGTRLAGVVDGFNVHVWNLASGSTEIASRFVMPVEDISFSPDSSWIAVCLSNGDVPILSVATHKVASTVRVSSAAASATFTPDNTRLVCAGRNGLLHIVRTQDWREIATLTDPMPGDESDISAGRVAFSPDGKTLAVQRRDGKLRIWRAP
jgi:WD40 repeat protein